MNNHTSTTNSRVTIKGKAYHGVNWNHYERVMDARNHLDDSHLKQLRDAQINLNTSTNKPIEYGKETGK